MAMAAVGEYDREVADAARGYPQMRETAGSPWTPQDRGAALCAALVFAAAAVVITVRGARDSAHE
jgi:hypothetical protein